MLLIREEEKRDGAPGRSRTSDLLVRSQLLYPAELRAHIAWGCNSLKILEFAPQSKRRQNQRNEVWRGVVRPEGFEPPTLWFEAKCSIQLSYGRGKQVLQTLKIADNPPHGNYAAATGSGGGVVTNIGIVSTMSSPARRRS
jgi:hypothetical protein